MRKSVYFILLVFLLLTSCDSTHMYDTSDLIKCELVNVVDGDTLAVIYDDEITKVRLIGIDTPESVHVDETKNTELGKIASEYTQELLADVEYVYLEFDTSMYDEYDRLLAYVYLSDEQAFEESLNYILVNAGYAVNKEFAPNMQHAKELATACEVAKTNENGLWKVKGVENVFGKFTR